MSLRHLVPPGPSEPLLISSGIEDRLPSVKTVWTMLLRVSIADWTSEQRAVLNWLSVLEPAVPYGSPGDGSRSRLELENAIKESRID